MALKIVGDCFCYNPHPPSYEVLTGLISIRRGRRREAAFDGAATVWFRRGSKRKRIVLFIDRRPRL